MKRPNADEHARMLGATIHPCIAWTWAHGFVSPEAGRMFVEWLEEYGYEHRGYYPAQPDSANPRLHLDGVRYR